MKRTFFQKIFMGQLTVAAAVIAIMSLVFFFAIRSSILSWNRDKKEELENLLLPILSKTYRFSGGFEAAAVEAAIRPYIPDSLYVYVFDENRRPLLLMEQGRRVSQQEMEAGTGTSLSSFFALNKLAAIKDSNSIVGYLAVDSEGFLSYKANRIFLDTMQRAIFTGSAAAILCISIFSWIISSSFSKKTEELAAGIASFSPDNDNPPPKNTGLKEFDSIVHSVEILHTKLKQEARLRRQWMQDISHDLRTPITAVKMQIEAMSDGVLPATQERIKSLFSELIHIEKLVCNLQDLSRYESPEMTLAKMPVNPYTFINDVYDRFSFLAVKQGVTFNCQCRIGGILVLDTETQNETTYPVETGYFDADELLLQRCVSNLLQNALQHTARGGHIALSLSEETENGAPFISIQITNTGSITDEDIPFIFDRLYRGDKSRSTTGSGLGLSIAKAIVILHGGTISAVNLPAKTGIAPRVLFTVRIPRTVPATAAGV